MQASKLLVYSVGSRSDLYEKPRWKGEKNNHCNLFFFTWQGVINLCQLAVLFMSYIVCQQCFEASDWHWSRPDIYTATWHFWNSFFPTQPITQSPDSIINVICIWSVSRVWHYSICLKCRLKHLLRRFSVQPLSSPWKVWISSLKLKSNINLPYSLCSGPDTWCHHSSCIQCRLKHLLRRFSVQPLSSPWKVWISSLKLKSNINLPYSLCSGPDTTRNIFPVPKSLGKIISKLLESPHVLD